MKKISVYILAIFSIVLMACQKEPQELQQLEQDGKVTIILDFTIPDAVPITKTLGENVDLNANGGLWVLVYESGYRVEVVKAENLTLADTSTNRYTCKLTLSVSEKKRNLHFISMDGFAEDDAPYEETRLGSLTSADDLDAYWQIRTVSSIPYNVTGSTAWTTFLSELKGSTEMITLVRNFAKVTMNNSTTNFQLESFKVFKTPDRGYVAPYISSGSGSGFVSGYDALEYSGDNTITPAVKGAVDLYPGRMPNGCELLEYDSTADVDGASFYNYAVDNDVAQYFYERPVPKEDPAFIIVKGKFDSDNDSSYDDESFSYYKINLRDKDGNYYALLRGFRFKVNVEEVTATGYGTVLEAYNSAGSGDISTSLDFSSINNISDNVCRLFVNSTSITQIKAGTIELKYKFIPDFAHAPNTTENQVVDVDVETNTGVEITVNSPETGIQPSIAKNASDQWDVTIGTADDSEGWRTITIKTNNPESLYKEQAITIRGRGNNGTISTVLQREIHIIVRPTLRMSVECPASVVKTAGTSVTVKLGFEDELPESIFPLNIRIEADQLTLTPDNSKTNNNLPVESGLSAKTGKPTFYFVKTVTYAAYSSATKTTVGGKSGMREIDCYFKTNTAASATNIYVSNGLFNLAETSFTNP